MRTVNRLEDIAGYKNYTRINGIQIKETTKAIQFLIDSAKVYLPKSQMIQVTSMFNSIFYVKRWILENSKVKVL